jgi:hypothetical protein
MATTTSANAIYTYHRILFFWILSVMKPMHGAAEYDENFNGRDSDYYIPHMQLVEAY